MAVIINEETKSAVTDYLNKETKYPKLRLAYSIVSGLSAGMIVERIMINLLPAPAKLITKIIYVIGCTSLSYFVMTKVGEFAVKDFNEMEEMIDNIKDRIKNVDENEDKEA